MDSLNRQVGELKTYMVMLQMDAEANKIRWGYLAAGDYVTDNKTAEGRAKN